MAKLLEAETETTTMSPMEDIRDFINASLSRNQLDRAVTFADCMTFLNQKPELKDVLLGWTLERLIDMRANQVARQFLVAPKPEAIKQTTGYLDRLDPVVAAFNGRLLAAEIREGVSMAQASAKDLETAYNLSMRQGRGHIEKAYYYRLVWEQINGTGQTVGEVLDNDALLQLLRQAKTKAEKI